jgi:HEAT repeat protein
MKNVPASLLYIDQTGVRCLMNKTRITAGLLTLPAILFLLCGLYPAQSQDESTARTAEEILTEAGETPTPDAINELFINVSEWDEAHSEVQEESRDALIEMGALAVPTLLENWLSSVDVRRRVELDAIIGEIGHPAAQYLIPYLQSDEYYTRKHAAYLLGDTAAIGELDDPLAIGPLPDDEAALEALVEELQTENDWHVIQSVLGAIGTMRDPTRIELLSTYLTNEEESVRLAATIALGRIPVQEAVPKIMEAFSDEVMSVREAAVLALSTKTMGNLAFEALVGRAILPATGTRIRLCSLEALKRYLDTIATEETPRAAEQRARAYDAAKTVLEVARGDEMWRARGYAVELIGHTWNPDAVAFLETQRTMERHPFILGKIDEAIETIMEGRPQSVEEAE